MGIKVIQDPSKGFDQKKVKPFQIWLEFLKQLCFLLLANEILNERHVSNELFLHLCWPIAMKFHQIWN
jgi:hypothetical protein